MSQESALSTRHEALHDALLAEIERMLVWAVALDFDRALAACRRVAAAIGQHRTAEERALETLPAEPPLPRGAGAALVVAEHDKLDALLGRADETLVALAGLELDEAGRRLALVRHLESLTRVRALLEHHTQREMELVYPHLELHLPPEPGAALAASIEALLQRDSPAPVAI